MKANCHLSREDRFAGNRNGNECLCKTFSVPWNRHTRDPSIHDLIITEYSAVDKTAICVKKTEIKIIWPPLRWDDSHD